MPMRVQSGGRQQFDGGAHGSTRTLRRRVHMKKLIDRRSEGERTVSLGRRRGAGATAVQ